MDMAQISCQLRQQSLHICSLAIPGNQAMYRGGMSKVMQSRLITAAVEPQHAGPSS
jgi:hypothetical protein